MYDPIKLYFCRFDIVKSLWTEPDFITMISIKSHDEDIYLRHSSARIRSDTIQDLLQSNTLKKDASFKIAAGLSGGKSKIADEIKGKSGERKTLNSVMSTIFNSFRLRFGCSMHGTKLLRVLSIKGLNLVQSFQCPYDNVKNTVQQNVRLLPREYYPLKL